MKMRLWSLHPSLLDRVGLVALWREGLLAQKVLRGETDGYIHHLQLIRFKEMKYPVSGLAYYLWVVANEANFVRGYHFDRRKLDPMFSQTFKVTEGQLEFEFNHLLSKVKNRDYNWYIWLKEQKPIPHSVTKVENIHSLCGWEKGVKI